MSDLVNVRDAAGTDRSHPRVRGAVQGATSDPMAPGNIYSELRKTKMGSVLNSPNGPVKYINPGHPWLDSPPATSRRTPNRALQSAKRSTDE